LRSVKTPAQTVPASRFVPPVAPNVVELNVRSSK
jgi:hypothetical protein